MICRTNPIAARGVLLLLAAVFVGAAVGRVVLSAAETSAPASAPAVPREATLPVALAPAATPASNDGYPRGTVLDSRGSQVNLADVRGTAATVFVCFSIECPISNGYLPALNDLSDRFAARGVALVALDPNVHHSLRDLARHRHDFKPHFALLKDHGGRAVGQLGLTVCPEACVVDAQRRVRYRGRIDDRYVRRGGAPRDVRRADLQIAIEEVLSGKTVSIASTKPVGCPAQLSERAAHRASATQSATNGQQAAATVTYRGQIANILAEHCQECHRPSGIGPFSLCSYDDASSWADDIRQFTADGTMPPWKPVDGHGEFKNRRKLSQGDKDQISRWVTDGCPEGAELPEPPVRQFTSGWRLGEPDLVLSPSEDYRLAADGKDVYRCFVLPTDFDRDRYVEATEFLPGNSRVVHHVIAYLDTSGRAERLDKLDKGPGYTSGQGGPGFLPAGGLGGWAPGNMSGRLPEGMAKILPRGSRVVMQVHYHKSGKAETDRTRMGIYFARGKVNRAVRALPILPPGGPLSGMRIPAGDANYEVRCSYVISRDLLAVNITPHMHLLGKDMRVTATSPAGVVRPLVYVKDWDFNWQEMYQYHEPLMLAKGTRIDLVAHFDNSPGNVRNPSDPPQTVRWGEQTTDEMCIAFIEFAPLEKARTEEELRPPTPEAAMSTFVRGQMAAAPDQQARDAMFKRLGSRLRGFWDTAAETQRAAERSGADAAAGIEPERRLSGERQLPGAAA